MSKITNHDNSYSGGRNATQPVARTAMIVASLGPLQSLTEGNPLWYDGDTSLLSKTYHRLIPDQAEKRRSGR